MPNDKTIIDARTEFIEKIGMVIQMEGMPRIAGRMFGLLVFDGTEISFTDLATQLQVSRGSVSSNAKFLEERGLIKRFSKSGERQDYFQLADNPYATMISGVVRRMERAKNEINETLTSLRDISDQTDKPQDILEIEKRLKDYINFYDAMMVNLINSQKTLAKPE
jgi:DNA-binding transcriptional regulator GbsR (MarR family)